MNRAAFAIGVLAAGSAAAQQPKPGPFQPNIERGRAYLYSALEKDLGGGAGKTPILCFGAYALLSTAPKNEPGVQVDPRLRALIVRVRREADRAEGADWTESHWGNYGLAAMVMCLCADDPDAHRPALEKIVALLLKRQTKDGSWTYPHTAIHDTSQTQFVATALWDASRAGVPVPLEAWDRAAWFQIATQSAGAKGAGGFRYNPDVPAAERKIDQGAGPPTGVTASMSVAGLSTLLIGRDRIPALRAGKHSPFAIGELVRPAAEDGKPAFVPRSTKETLDAAIAAAEGFVGRIGGVRGEFVLPGREIYYCYGLERVAALLRSAAMKALVDHHDAFVAGLQKADGHWDGLDGPVCDTAMAIMCLGRVTAKKEVLRPIAMVPRSTMVGDYGVPKAQAGTASDRQAERYRTSPHSDLDEVVRALENPALAIPENAEARIEAATPAELVARFGGDLRKLQALAKDPRPAARVAALAALAGTKDFRIAPILCDALSAKENEVYAAARDGLRRLSHDPAAFDLPAAEARGDARSAPAIARVKAWIAGLRLEQPAELAYAPAGG